MGSEGTSMMPDRATIKELGRRRVFTFFWVFVLFAIGNVVGEENDIFLHVVDDYADLALAIVAIVVLALWWKKSSLKELRMTNNILTVLAVGLVLATLFAISQEYGDPEDFGNEIPTLLFAIFMLINRFT
jgi:uncharacterized membrane protein YccC